MCRPGFRSLRGVLACSLSGLARATLYRGRALAPTRGNQVCPIRRARLRQEEPGLLGLCQNHAATKPRSETQPRRSTLQVQHLVGEGGRFRIKVVLSFAPARGYGRPCLKKPSREAGAMAPPWWLITIALSGFPSRSSHHRGHQACTWLDQAGKTLRLKF